MNKYKSEPELCSPQHWNSSVVIQENHDGRGQWCRGDWLAFRFCSQKLQQLSRRGVKYFGLGSKITSTLPNLGKRQQSLKFGHLLRKASGNLVPVWNPLLALCSLMDSGHDVYFTHHAGCCAIHTKTAEEIEIHRRSGKFETDAEVVLPSHRQVKPQDQVITKTNLCSRWKIRPPVLSLFIAPDP